MKKDEGRKLGKCLASQCILTEARPTDLVCAQPETKEKSRSNIRGGTAVQRRNRELALDEMRAQLLPPHPTHSFSSLNLMYSPLPYASYPIS